MYPDRIADSDIVVTFATAIEQLDGLADLTPARRRDLKSALRSFCRHLDLDPATTPASIALVRQRAAALAPAVVGLTTKSWANIRSGTITALRLLGLVPLKSKPHHLDPAWRVLWQKLYDDGNRLRFGLSGFMYFCNSAGIEPDAVDDDAFTAYYHHLKTVSLIKKPEQQHRQCCLHWNKAVETVPGWPQRAVSLPSYRDSYRLPAAAFAESFHADVAYWRELLAGQYPFDERARSRPLRPRTVEGNTLAIYRFASAAVHAGIPIESFRSLGDVARIEVVKAGCQWLIERNNGDVPNGLVNLVLPVRFLAEHYVGVDDTTLQELKRIANRLNPRKGKKGLTRKNRERLRQFDDPKVLSQLLNLPDDLVAEAHSNRVSAKKAALLVETALAIQLLIMAPIRIGNLVRLRLDKHIVRGRGRAKRRGRRTENAAHLLLDEDETKNSHSYEVELPPELLQLLDLYCARYRPLFDRHGSPYLFPGNAYGEPAGHKHEVTLSGHITKTIRNRVGIEMNVHLFRHFAARMMLLAEPGNYEAARRLLGHSSVDTTTNAYSGMETVSAARRYDAHVLKLKDDLSGSKGAKRGGSRHP